MPIKIATGLAHDDNAMYLVHDDASGRTISIDAADADAVTALAAAHGWSISDILITHKHWDHVDGIPGLMEKFRPRLVVPAMLASQFPDAAQFVKEGDRIVAGDLHFDVWETPGHCQDHVSYLLARERKAFVADVMFIMGCGRIIEGTPDQLYTSLQRLGQLPEDTEVYCGHDYSLKNARFGVAAEPNSAIIKARLNKIEAANIAGTLHSITTIGDEKATNVFLRAADVAQFATLRLARNTF
jgi:hydroxyacylglutathione hydrolase